MKCPLLVCSLTFVGLVIPQVAQADLVYDVNLSFPVTGSEAVDIVGTVTVAGTGGVLTSADDPNTFFTTYSLTFSNPGGSATALTLTPSNSDWFVDGSASVTADNTSLMTTVLTSGSTTNRVDLISTPIPPGSYSFNHASLLIDTIPPQRDNQIGATIVDPFPVSGAQPFTNSFTFGTVGVPEPSSFSLLSLALVCFFGIHLRRLVLADRPASGNQTGDWSRRPFTV